MKRPLEDELEEGELEAPEAEPAPAPRPIPEPPAAPSEPTPPIAGSASISTHEVALPPGTPPLQPGDPMLELPASSFDALDFPFELDPFQRQALACVERGESVLVSAHTSAGKTVVAQYAVALSLKRGQRVVYTSPIKALSNQKYRELQGQFEDVENACSKCPGSAARCPRGRPPLQRPTRSLRALLSQAREERPRRVGAAEGLHGALALCPRVADSAASEHPGRAHDGRQQRQLRGVVPRDDDRGAAQHAVQGSRARARGAVGCLRRGALHARQANPNPNPEHWPWPSPQPQPESEAWP